MYSFIDQDVLENFVKSRTTPKFLAKSQKGQYNRSRIFVYIGCLGEDTENLKRR